MEGMETAVAAEESWYWARPGLAATWMRRLAELPRRPLVFSASQRTGKTAFLRKELSEAAREAGVMPVWLPLGGTHDPLARIEQTLADEVRQHGQPGPARGLDVLSSIEALLEAGAGRPILLLLDDAHVLARPDAGGARVALFRAFAAYPRRVWLVLAAPPGPQFQSLLATHAHAGLQIALHEELPLLGAEFLDHVEGLLPPAAAPAQRREELGWAFEQLLYRPGELIGFARRWTEQYPEETVERALARYHALASPDRLYAQRFTGCPPLVQRLLVEIAVGHTELFALSTRRALGQSLDREEPIPVPEIAEALRALEASRLIFRTGASGFLLEDEGYARWLRALAGHAPVHIVTQPQSSAEGMSLRSGNRTSV